jgi:hypothetical protein
MSSPFILIILLLVPFSLAFVLSFPSLTPYTTRQKMKGIKKEGKNPIFTAPISRSRGEKQQISIKIPKTIPHHKQIHTCTFFSSPGDERRVLPFSLPIYPPNELPPYLRQKKP